MRVLLFGLALLIASALPARAEVTVRVAAGRVDITATAAPLSEVLDRLARQTGMKVVYDGPAPRQLVTVSLMGRVPAEAVHDLLEGQGLNYALLGDAAGTGVQTLLMTGSTAPAASSASSFTPVTRPRAGAPPLSSPDSIDEPEDEPEDEEPIETPGSPGTPNAATEGLPAGLPGSLQGGLGSAAKVIPASAGTTNAPAPAVPPIQVAPALPTMLPQNMNPGFVPVSPLSPLGPFVPALPGGAPIGGLPGGAPVGGPGAPNEPPEPTEPPLD